MTSPTIEETPKFLVLLCESDKSQYFELKSFFHKDLSKSRRGHRIDNFTEKLKKVRRYIYHNSSDVWKRSMVCGIIFLKEAIAINITQLMHLFGRCKSSINGSLQMLGFSVKPFTPEINKEIEEIIPSKNDYFESKKWTVRIGSLPELRADCSAKPETEPTQREEICNVENILVRYHCPIKFRHKFQAALLPSEA